MDENEARGKEEKARQGGRKRKRNESHCLNQPETSHSQQTKQNKTTEGSMAFVCSTFNTHSWLQDSVRGVCSDDNKQSTTKRRRGGKGMGEWSGGRRERDRFAFSLLCVCVWRVFVVAVQVECWKICQVFNRSDISLPPWQAAVYEHHPAKISKPKKRHTIQTQTKQSNNKSQ